MQGGGPAEHIDPGHHDQPGDGGYGNADEEYLRGKLAAPLYPGGSGRLNLILTNPHRFVLRIRALTVRVLAAMSGGVDSAVAAARAVDAGHDVTGVHLALSRTPAGAAQVQKLHRELFNNAVAGLCETIQRITGVAVREADVEPGTYTLSLEDGRSGTIRIDRLDADDSGKYRAVFVGEGPLG